MVQYKIKSDILWPEESRSVGCFLIICPQRSLAAEQLFSSPEAQLSASSSKHWKTSHIRAQPTPPPPFLSLSLIENPPTGPLCSKPPTTCFSQPSEPSQSPSPFSTLLRQSQAASSSSSPSANWTTSSEKETGAKCSALQDAWQDSIWTSKLQTLCSLSLAKVVLSRVGVCIWP